jgi:thiamine-monophosphate kinase
MSRDEFQTIQRYFSLPVNDPNVILGIGDDAAVVNATGPLAIAADTLVEGVHFPRNTPPDAIGYRALAVNLSDLAAMGARPQWCTMALTVAQAEETWLESFSAGFFQLASDFQVSLIGGDLTKGPLTVTLNLFGSIDKHGLLTRAGGHVGDDVYVTGSLGDAAAGLALINEDAANAGREHQALAERFYRPTARVAEGQALSQVASSAIDVSDGLIADLGHLCQASGCGAVLDVEQLPLSAELLRLFPPQTAQAYGLGGGDDYELIFTAPAAKADAVEAALEPLGTRAQRIGELVAGTGVTCRRQGEAFNPVFTGYKHF